MITLNILGRMSVPTRDLAGKKNTYISSYTYCLYFYSIIYIIIIKYLYVINLISIVP